MSTLHPLFLLKELIHKHIKEETPLYIAFLDSEKAYDSVWRDGIFFKLIEVIRPQFWLVLKDYYDKSDGILKINGQFIEEIIEITRGVKQGGILSPQLFNFFIDELIKKISSLGIGCKVKDENVPIMGFCDDTILLATLLKHLSQLVEECEEYSKKWMLKYNIKKSVVLNCGHQIVKDEDIEIKMDGVNLPVVKASKYLGININKENDDDKQILEKFQKVQKCFYGLSSFGIKPPGINPKSKAFLFNTFCKPVGTYGIGLMKLKNNTLQQMNIIQNNLMRYTLGIPYRTHIRNLMKALGIIDSETTMLMEKCVLIKLLHRTELTKKILVENIENQNREWWMYNDIQKICDKLGIEPKEVCFYPDRTREKLKERFFETNDVEMVLIEEIKMLLSNYNFKNKRILVDLIKLVYNQDNE
jgi:hypothetical protein